MVWRQGYFLGEPMNRENCTRRRWRFQYTLRSLLLFFLVASIFFSWFGLRYRAAIRQREAVKKLDAIGALVYYDYRLAGQSAPSAPGVFEKLAWQRFFCRREEGADLCRWRRRHGLAERSCRDWRALN